MLLAVGKLIFPSVTILSFWVSGGNLHLTGSLVCTVPPPACSIPEEVCGVVVFCIVSFCKHYSSRLPIPGCVQADFIVYLGHSWAIRETRRACGSCVAGMHSLWSAFNPFRSCCVQAGGLAFSVLPFQEDNLKSSLISLCLITKIPLRLEAKDGITNSALHPPRYFFLVEIKQTLHNKQFSTTLQLNAFTSESESLSFFDIIIFNSHPRADHRVFMGVWWVVFTGAPQQGVRALAPAVLDTACHSYIWLLPPQRC